MSISLIVAAAVAQAAPTPAPPSPIEIRFCPEGRVRTYPLDSLRGINGLLLQNVAIINRSTAPVTLERVDIALHGPRAMSDTRAFGPEALAAAAKSAAAVKANGMMELAAFQFCDGRLLKDTTLATGTTLAPGEALMLMQNSFAWKSARTELRVSAIAGQATTTAAIPIDGTASKTPFRWPLPAGRTWLVGSGASFHTTHRWAVPEEFALDIFAIDGAGSSHRAAGKANADFLAYDAEVLAAADGEVVRIVSGSSEDPPMLRQAGEPMADYYGRIGARQAENIGKGEAGVLGDAIIVGHGNAEFSVYAHLVPGSIRVKPGERVRSGQSIARLGSSGNSTEPHLHFQVCDKPSGISCAGIPPNFTGIDLPTSDGPRPIQSGDLVRVAE